MDKKIINNINNFYGKTSDIQIQQGTLNSFQWKTDGQNFDYKKVLDIIQEIKSYDKIIKKEYGNKAEEFRDKIEKIEELAQKKEKPSKIKVMIEEMKELSNGVVGSLIATGIVALLEKLV